MTTILEIMRLAPVKPFQHNKATPRNAVDPSLIFGLELETEGIRNVDSPDDLYVPGMGGAADNSLRGNNGFAWEYITKPATYSVMMHILESFFGKAKFTENNYSERCSIHVHTNVQDLTVPQLQAICYLYQVFERVLYTYVGADRDKNIFCVPWNQTTMSYQMLNQLSQAGLPGLKRWQKYTGLNLIPITDKGTIEFRHMPGTCDINRISTWLQIIACLFVYGKSNTVDTIQKELLNLNTSSEYRGFMMKVFGDYAHVLDTPHLNTFLEEGVIELKYATLSSRTDNKKTYNDTNTLLRQVEAMQRARGLIAGDEEGNNLLQWLPEPVAVRPAQEAGQFNVPMPNEVFAAQPAGARRAPARPMPYRNR